MIKAELHNSQTSQLTEVLGAFWGAECLKASSTHVATSIVPHEAEIIYVVPPEISHFGS